MTTSHSRGQNQALPSHLSMAGQSLVVPIACSCPIHVQRGGVRSLFGEGLPTSVRRGPSDLGFHLTRSARVSRLRRSFDPFGDWVRSSNAMLSRLVVNFNASITNTQANWLRSRAFSLAIPPGPPSCSLATPSTLLVSRHPPFVTRHTRYSEPATHNSRHQRGQVVRGPAPLGSA